MIPFGPCVCPECPLAGVFTIAFHVVVSSDLTWPDNRKVGDFVEVVKARGAYEQEQMGEHKYDTLGLLAGKSALGDGQAEEAVTPMGC